MELSQTDIEFITQENLKIRDILNYLKPKILKAYEDGTGIKIIKEIIKNQTKNKIDISYNTLSKFIYSNKKKAAMDAPALKNSEDIEKILITLNEINKKIENKEEINCNCNCPNYIIYIILFASIVNIAISILK